MAGRILDENVVRGQAGIGVQYRGFVVEIPRVSELGTMYIGYGFGITEQIVITPQIASNNVRSRGMASEENFEKFSVFATKLEVEYKINPSFSLAATAGRSWRTGKESGMAPDDTVRMNGMLATFGGKFYF
jgi:hypothetical protein